MSDQLTKACVVLWGVTVLADVSHVLGSDLSLDSAGAIVAATGVDVSNQRVLRRLGTNIGGYIFSLDYGAGIPGRIGGDDVAADIETLVKQQMLLEPSVASTPAPNVTVSSMDGGMTRLQITYTSAETGETVALEL